MAKIHPRVQSTSFPSCSSPSEDQKEIYTIWMKSLVLNGNGCTIYGSSGKFVYRIDNYDTRCSTRVYLMDVKGKVICTLLRKKLRIHEHWNGYKCEGSENGKPWFQVEKISKVFSKGVGFSCEVTMVLDDESSCFSCFRIQGCSQKSEFQIINVENGTIPAQVKRKQTSNGVMLGDDVLSLEVDPQMDHSLIMALIVVHGLMSHKI